MIILFSTGCSRCKILKDTLDQKGIDYIENTDIDEMIKIGITVVPILKVDDTMYDFNDALMYIKSNY